MSSRARDLGASNARSTLDDRRGQRFATPEEVVDAISFLAFDAPFATGSVLPLDGGTTMV